MQLFRCSWFKYRFIELDLVTVGKFCSHFGRVLGSIMIASTPASALKTCLARCAESVRTKVFASFARAHERVLVQNVSDFPQSKLNSEIKAPFLLNKHGDLYFLLHKSIVHIILYNILKV